MGAGRGGSRAGEIRTRYSLVKPGVFNNIPGQTGEFHGKGREKDCQTERFGQTRPESLAFGPQKPPQTAAPGGGRADLARMAISDLQVVWSNPPSPRPPLFATNCRRVFISRSRGDRGNEGFAHHNLWVRDRHASEIRSNTILLGLLGEIARLGDIARHDTLARSRLRHPPEV